MLEVLEQMTEHSQLKEYKGNKLQLAIIQKVSEKQDTALEAYFKAKLQESLGISSNRLTQILNNHSQLSLKEAFKAAQVLDVRVDDLIKY